MATRAIDVTNLSNQELKNIIENHRRKNATDSATYLEALAEHGRRAGKGTRFRQIFSNHSQRPSFA